MSVYGLSGRPYNPETLARGGGGAGNPSPPGTPRRCRSFQFSEIVRLAFELFLDPTSDGEFPVAMETSALLRNLRKQSKLRVHGLLIGSCNRAAMDALCDQVHRLGDWNLGLDGVFVRRMARSLFVRSAQHSRFLLLPLAWLVSTIAIGAESTSHELATVDSGRAKLVWAPAPVDNPLKGLVPYVGQGGESFPCSMEFHYFPLSQIVTGQDRYDWEPLESKLKEVSSRGRQLVCRFYLDYPNGSPGIPPI